MSISVTSGPDHPNCCQLMFSESKQITQIMLSLKARLVWGPGTSTSPEATLLRGLCGLGNLPAPKVTVQEAGGRG